MAVELAPLPFESGSLEPHISQKTIEFHYGKHHKAYVDNLNALIAGTPLDKCELTEIVLMSQDQTKIFNNAAQAWNHTFFWNCLTAPRKTTPSENLRQVLAKNFASFDEFKSQFNAQCKDLFGSGWTWLVMDSAGRLKIKPMANAGNPMVEGEKPLLTCDVWEHAYYLDYQNQRPKFVENFWSVVDWDSVEKNLDSATSQPIKRGTMQSTVRPNPS